MSTADTQAIGALCARVRKVDVLSEDAAAAWSKLAALLPSPSLKDEFVKLDGIPTLYAALVFVNKAFGDTGMDRDLLTRTTEQIALSLYGLSKEARFETRTLLLEVELVKELCEILRNYTASLAEGTKHNHPAIRAAVASARAIDRLAGWGGLTRHYAAETIHHNGLSALVLLLSAGDVDEAVVHALTCLRKIARAPGQAVATSPGLLDKIIATISLEVEAGLSQLASGVLAQLCFNPHVAIKAMVLGAVPKLLACIAAAKDGFPVSEAVHCLAVMTLTETVRALVGSQLAQDREHLLALVKLMGDSRRRTADQAVVCVALLLLDDRNHALMASVNAESAITAFLDAWHAIGGGVPSEGNTRYDQGDVELVHKMLPLLGSRSNPILQGVFAYMASFNLKACMNQESLKLLIIKNIVPPLRGLAWHEIPIVAKMSRRALELMEDKRYADLTNTQNWLQSLLLTKRESIAKTLAKEHVDLEKLLSPQLLDGDITLLLTSMFEKSVPTGDIMTLIASVRVLRSKVQFDIAIVQALVDGLEEMPGSQEEEGSKDVGPDAVRSILKASPGGSMPVVFISYSWSNKALVKEIKESLEASGITCWMDEQVMKGGQQLFEMIDKGVSEASVFVACISDNYATSENCRREIQLAADRRKLILPVWVEEPEMWPPRGPIAPLLAGRLYINCATNTTFRENKSQLIQAVRSSLSR